MGGEGRSSRHRAAKVWDWMSKSKGPGPVVEAARELEVERC